MRVPTVFRKDIMTKLLIVESPTKARTIGRMLGKDFMIVASMGHIRDLPEHELGVDIEHGFAPRYVDNTLLPTIAFFPVI